MKKISVSIGLISALFLTVILISYTIGFIALILNHPEQWVNMSTYVEQIHKGWYHILTFCHILVFLAAPLYLILISCIDDNIADEYKIYSKISINFAIILTVLGSINYFIQFSMVKLSISKSQFQGLEQYIQLNPYSAIYAIVMLGWTFFLGLSSLFISMTFKNKKIDKILKISFITNGLFCLVGFLGYILDTLLLVVFYQIGMGISMIIISISLIVYFRNKQLN